ncbi:glycogen debranching enzyme [Burkholderia cenocepacia]|nr:glycogen debranching enzyme [Burkholderia cenocepacia]
MTAHDGFTLADLVSYAGKHNDANGEDNRDGRDDNCSANWGVEGPTDDAAIRDVRLRVARSMLATLFTALGTPMLVAGDEFGRTQHGNNNAYCQDNELSWLDWDLAHSDAGVQMTRFVSRLAALRRMYPVMSAPRYPSGDRDGAPGMREIDWFDERGDALTVPAWEDGERRALTMRRVGTGRTGRTEALLVMLNASADTITFMPPAPVLDYRILLDTATPDSGPRSWPEAGLDVAAHAAVIAVAAVPPPDQSS